SQGELAHRLVKMLYGRTNKKDAMKQVAKQVNRREVFRGDQSAAAAIEYEELANALLEAHHIISESRRNPVNMYAFVNERHNGRLDPAKKEIIPKLQDHLPARLLSREFSGDEHDDFTDDDRNDVRIIGSALYSVKVIHVNYTTYDIRRASDTINPRPHCYITVRLPETGPDAHQFRYAQVLGIFHGVVLHAGPRSCNPSKRLQMDFLWVHWLGVEPGHRSGRRHARLPKLGSVPDTDPCAFGFLDPS
ncbi:hypothetical protein FPV67DRAFT_1416255, partial [Lyophyllum atratum]